MNHPKQALLSHHEVSFFLGQKLNWSTNTLIAYKLSSPFW
ncbi:hypothetical protein AsAng_0014820 [Aureispira anguillae]|uniref:Uncharacterized protein n=1 Tax=Aureispira anguillae TaxID=2864201 RepID=A0A915YCY2_9BACT|nr:hypothetical protein AsAng_0014820 [Aureispira anguillae]